MVSIDTHRTSTAVHLASVIRSRDIIAEVAPLAGGSLRAKTETWASYWQPVQWLGVGTLVSALDRLERARAQYIDSGFDLEKGREYCFRYFFLLDAVLASAARSEKPSQWKRVLQLVLALESFPVTDLSPTRGSACAGTTTIRNPAYLLSRLQAPDARDDPKRLPLLMLPNGPPRLYFHYRQYGVEAEAPQFSLLGYLPNDEASRQAGLRITGDISQALHSSPDPYVWQRARRLWTGVLLPLLESTMQRLANGTPLEILDVGAGSGRLTAELSRSYVRWGLENGFNPLLRLWFVERSGHDPTSLFRDKSLSWHVRGVTILPSDYRSWLVKSRMMPTSAGMRLGIVSKVFNLASSFAIRRVDRGSLPSPFRVFSMGRNAGYLPAQCLAPGGSGPDSLVVPGSKVAVDGGHLYPQLSLMPYYRGLSILVDGVDPRIDPTKTSLPVRLFNPDSLMADDDSSVLDRLCRQCTYVLVEDQDLRPEDLLDHLRRFGLRQLGAFDLTKSMRLKANYAYVLWDKSHASPRLEGERIW